MKLLIGDEAPNFSLTDQLGKVHKLNDYKGTWLVIYFYPKDDTPGCTKEACGFRDIYAQIKKKAEVIGVSADNIQSHKKFAEKYQLPFPLLADPEKEMIQAYGVWGLKKFMGKEYLGILRTTFIINPQQVISKIYPKVRTGNHNQEVYDDLSVLQSN